MFATDFTLILRLLQKTMGNHVVRHDLHGPVLILLWNRISRTIRLFDRLVALWRAGIMPKPRPVRSAPQPRAGQTRPAAAGKPVTIPRTFAWLLKLTGMPAATAASQLRHWMTDEELRRFLADCPQAARLIRPVCHMIGMRPTEVELAPIRLPPRPRKPRPPRPPKPPRLRQNPARGFTRAQIDRMTAADLTAHYGRLPPHFPLPIPNLNYIRRKIAAG